MKLPYQKGDYFLILGSLVFVVLGWLVSVDDDGASVWWSVGFFACCLLLGLLSPILRKRRVHQARVESVSFDELGVTRTVDGEFEESIAWDELAEVVIQTNDQGPWFDDVHWFLVGQDRSKGVVINNDAEGLGDLLERLQQLPGFDDRQVIEAMGCTDNAVFVAWRREASREAKSQ